MSSASQFSPILDAFQSSVFDVLHVRLTELFRENATGKSILKEMGRLEIFIYEVRITAEDYLYVEFAFNDEYRFVWRGGQFSDLFIISLFRGEYRPADAGPKDVWLPL